MELTSFILLIILPIFTPSHGKFMLIETEECSCIGKCDDKLDGKFVDFFWCYVDKNSGCSDKKKSTNRPALTGSQSHWSSMACKSDVDAQNKKTLETVVGNDYEGTIGLGKYVNTCFPGESTVMLDGEQIKTMQDLRIGDNILTVENKKLIPTKVLGFLDKKINNMGEYLNLVLENERSLYISARHAMFIKGDDSTILSILAKDVSIGDVVIVGDGKETGFARVMDINLSQEKGAYVPLTEAGTLLVDGVLVSSYTNVIHWLGHIIATPVRWWPSLLLDNQESQDIEGVRTYPWLAREILNFMGLATMEETKDKTVVKLSLLDMENMDKTEF